MGYTRPDVGLSTRTRDIICNEFCKALFFISMDRNDLFNSIGFLTMERNAQCSIYRMTSDSYLNLKTFKMSKLDFQNLFQPIVS